MLARVVRPWRGGDQVLIVFLAAVVCVLGLAIGRLGFTLGTEPTTPQLTVSQPTTPPQPVSTATPAAVSPTVRPPVVSPIPTAAATTPLPTPPPTVAAPLPTAARYRQPV